MVDHFNTTFFYSDGSNLAVTFETHQNNGNDVTLLKWHDRHGWVTVCRSSTGSRIRKLRYRGTPGYYAWNIGDKKMRMQTLSSH